MGFGLSGGSSSSESSFNQELANPEAWNQFYGNMGNLWSQMNPFMMGGFNYLPQIEPVMGAAADRGAAGSDYLMGGGVFDKGRTDDAYSQLMGMMGRPSATGQIYEDIIGGPGNTYVDPLVDAMRTAGTEALDTRMNQGAVSAAAMGQGGSSRQAMQNAMLERGALQDMNLQEQALREGAYETDMGWKMDIARLADQSGQMEQDRLMSMLTGADKNVMSGLQYQPTQQQLGMGMMAPYMQAFMMPWMAASAYSGAMGDPTVLSSGKSESSSASGGFGI